MKKLQKEDESLFKKQEAADGQFNYGETGFVRREGLMYQRWTPPRRGEEYAVEQLVLPQKC